jgi:hypothetical protein
MFRKLDLFPSSDEGSWRHVVFFVVLYVTERRTKSINSVFQSVMRHRLEPISQCYGLNIVTCMGKKGKVVPVLN